MPVGRADRRRCRGRACDRVLTAPPPAAAARSGAGCRRSRRARWRRRSASRRSSSARISSASRPAARIRKTRSKRSSYAALPAASRAAVSPAAGSTPDCSLLGLGAAALADPRVAGQRLVELLVGERARRPRRRRRAARRRPAYGCPASTSSAQRGTARQPSRTSRVVSAVAHDGGLDQPVGAVGGDEDLAVVGQPVDVEPGEVDEEVVLVGRDERDLGDAGLGVEDRACPSRRASPAGPGSRCSAKVSRSGSGLRRTTRSSRRRRCRRAASVATSEVARIRSSVSGSVVNSSLRKPLNSESVELRTTSSLTPD